MIARSHRFHGYGSLRGVYARGDTARGSLMSLKYATRPGKPYRAAVVVSRKVSKSAVVRNRIRRRVYEIIRQYDTQIADLDLVFSVYGDELAVMDSAQLTAAVDGLIKKAAKNPGDL